MRLVGAQHGFGHRDLVHLGGSVHHAQFGDVRPHGGQRRFVGHAQAAVQVHGPVDHLVKHSGRRRFDGGDLFAHRAVVCPVFVDQPGGVQHVQAVLHDHRVGVGDLFLGHLFFRQPFALGAPAQSALAHHVQGLAQHAHGAHGVMHPAAAEAGLGDVKALARRAEQVFGGHAAVVELQIRMHAIALFAVGADCTVAQDFEPRALAFHKEDRGALVNGDCAVGNEHDQ